MVRPDVLSALSFDEPFTTDFMRKHTDFEDMEAMVAASGRDVRTTEDFEPLYSL